MSWELISMPLIAAIIGWGTNVIAIRMLFGPEPIRIFGLELLGVLPKRRRDIAQNVGTSLTTTYSRRGLVAAVNTPENREQVTDIITNNLENPASSAVHYGAC